MKTMLSILLGLFAIASYAQPKSEVRSISDYSKLSVTGRCEVIYEQKSEERPYLRIEAGEHFLKNVDIKSQSNQLSISTNTGNLGVNFYNDEADLKIYTNSKNLTEVSLTGNSKVVLKGEIDNSKMKVYVSGSGLLVTTDNFVASDMDVYIKGNGMLKSKMLQSPDLSLYISGSGKIEIDEVKASRFSASISGSGTVSVISGAANLTHFRVKGNGIINAGKVKAENADTGISGSGKIIANASGFFKGRVNGSGQITYSGSPKKAENQVYGAGKVFPTELPTN